MLKPTIYYGKCHRSTIEQAPSLDQLPEKYRAHVKDTRGFSGYGKIEVDAHGIRRRKPGGAEKYKNRVFICKLCGWA